MWVPRLSEWSEFRIHFLPMKWEILKTSRWFGPRSISSDEYVKMKQLIWRDELKMKLWSYFTHHPCTWGLHITSLTIQLESMEQLRLKLNIRHFHCLAADAGGWFRVWSIASRLLGTKAKKAGFGMLIERGNLQKENQSFSLSGLNLRYLLNTIILLKILFGEVKN